MRSARHLCLILSLAGCGVASKSVERINSSPVARYLIKSADRSHAVKLGLTLEGMEDGYFVAYGATNHRDQIAAALPESILAASDDTASLNAYLTSNPEIMSGIYDYQRVLSDLNQWVTTVPQATEIVVYGKSAQGKDLNALLVHGSHNKGGDKPAVMITGATHGNEILTVDTVMGIAKYMIENRDSQRLKNILDHLDVWFVPVVSPDSYVARSRHVEGLDPNRDYPWPEDADHQSIGVIDAISKFALDKNLVGSLDYHSVGSYVMWPWAYTHDAPRGAAKLDKVAKVMANANGYRPGQISKIMYIAQGSSADYYYWKKESVSFGIEISQSRPSSPNSGEVMAAENTESTLKFLESLF